jgi:hypothetical protein
MHLAQARFTLASPSAAPNSEDSRAFVALVIALHQKASETFCYAALTSL